MHKHKQRVWIYGAWVLTLAERNEILNDIFFAYDISWTDGEACRVAMRSAKIVDNAIDNMMRVD